MASLSRPSELTHGLRSQPKRNSRYPTPYPPIIPYSISIVEYSISILLLYLIPQIPNTVNDARKGEIYNWVFCDFERFPDISGDTLPTFFYMSITFQIYHNTPYKGISHLLCKLCGKTERTSDPPISQRMYCQCALLANCVSLVVAGFIPEQYNSSPGSFLLLPGVVLTPAFTPP